MPTANPTPSQDPSDLLFNAGVLDSVVNAVDGTYTDRLGVRRLTLAGVDAAMRDAINYAMQYNMRGTWFAGTPYEWKDVFSSDGVTYVVLSSHTSTTVSADLASGKIGVFSGNAQSISYDNGSVKDVLDEAKPMQSYTALRAYTGSATGVRITQRGIAGFFQKSATDTTSADNGGTMIVDASGRRWVRLFDIEVSVQWFGASGYGIADDTSPLQSAINYCVSSNSAGKFTPLSLDGLSLKVTSTITIVSKNGGIRIDGKNAFILWHGSNARCFDVSGGGVDDGFDVNLSNFRISNSGRDTNSVGMFFHARRSRLQNIQFFSGFTKCLEVSQSQESVFEQIHVENYANGDVSQLTGIGVSLAHCLNIRFHGCYIGRTKSAFGQGDIIPGATNGNEGVIITDCVCAANEKQINSNGSTWLAFTISNNVLDLASVSGIVIAGQNHIIHGNWIADTSTSGSSATGFTCLDMTGASQVSVTSNTFWRGALASGTGSIKGIVGNGQQYSICNNQFNGTILNDGLISLSSSGGFATSGNIYSNGAIPVRPTGTAINQTRLDPHRRGFIYSGLSLGTDTSAFGAVLSSMGVSGGSVTAAANFVNGAGLSQFKTDTVDQTVSLPPATRACIYVGKDAPATGATNRSINAAGTINASGADYAEYEKNNNLAIKKGAIVGFKPDGTLTLTMSEAIRFGIKSTDPAIVGGDTWGTREVIGQEPVFPHFPDRDATEYEISSYNSERDAWASRLEAERATVDRIAYAGKVPVNVLGAIPGDYIVVDSDESGMITGKAVADPSFSEYRMAVGRVNKLLPDGRCEVAVLIH